MKSRTRFRFRHVAGESRQTLRARFTAAALIPLVAFSLFSPGLVPSAVALGPEPGEIGLPEDATPEQVLDRLCEELKKHPDQSIEMAKWSVAYFQSQIRTTPAFASALAIIFADCLAHSTLAGPGGTLPDSVAAGPLDELAQQIADTLIALYIAMNFPPGSTTAQYMVLAAIAVLDPPLASLVLEFFGKAIGSQIAESGFFGSSAPPSGGRDDLIRQLEELLSQVETPSPTPTASPSATPTPSVTPLPTPTPPVTPDVNT